MSPLHAAIQQGHADIVSSLLKCGADPNVVTKVRDRHSYAILYIPLKTCHPTSA